MKPNWLLPIVLSVLTMFVSGVHPAFGAEPTETDVDQLLKAFSSIPKKVDQAQPPSEQLVLHIYGNEVFKLPVAELDRGWESARLLTENDFSGPPYDRGLKVMKDYGWKFEVEADVDSDGAIEKAGVGVFQSVSGDRGTFVIAVGPGGVELLAKTSEKAEFGAIRFDTRGLVYGGCIECDDVRFFTFNEAQEEAACVVPQTKVSKILDAQKAFSEQPSPTTAATFLEHLPPDFCRFNALYGYDEVSGEAPLYDVNLFEILPKLEAHANPENLINQYVTYATKAYWFADNVNALQRSYRAMTQRYPAIFVESISRHASNSRMNAYKFLFDGPHPSNHEDFAEMLIARVCNVDSRSCGQLKEAWDSMQKHSRY